MSSSSPTLEQIQSDEFKKTLLTRLLEGVKGCQSRFGSRSELATEDEAWVARLCSAYEDVFSHGVRKIIQKTSNSNASFNWVPAALRSSDSPSFWPLVKSQLSKHEAERFLLLHNVRTDAGRCRAWIRASLNEHSLERYILIILSLENLKEFYEPWAFLRDHELNAILPQTAAGLGSVFFALTVDNPKLDSFSQIMAKDVPEATPVLDLDAQEAVEVADQAILALSPDTLANNVPTATASASIAESPLSKSSKVSKKKKKRPPVNFVSFDDEEPSVDNLSLSTSSVHSSLPSTTVGTPVDKKSFQGGGAFEKDNSDKQTSTKVVVTSPDDKMEGRVKEFNNNFDDNGDGGRDEREELGSENESSEPSTASINVISSSKTASSAHLQAGDTSSIGNSSDLAICSTSLKSVDCISVHSVYSDCSERLDLECSDLLAGLEIPPTSQRLKPISGDVIGNNNSSNSGGRGSSASSHHNSELFTHDLIPVPSYDFTKVGELNLDDVSAASSKMQTPVTPTTPVVGAASASSRSAAIDSLMTSSISSTYSTRNEDAVQKLKAILDREIETVAALRADLAEEKRNSSNQIKILEAKIESLGKDNEILRHQLKKYVGAVQLLKREGRSRRMSLENNDESDINNCDPIEIDDASHEAAEYERKLIQVAEMHGELMEFNSHLQKLIQRKDIAIKRLKEELVDLRGPLASSQMGTGDGDEYEDDDSWDIVDSFSSVDNNSTGSVGRGRNATNQRRTNLLHNERVLINIWIPSAFLTGATNDLHHVYQVFVRIKDTEWNIYRRYSQFYSLHRELSKNDGVVQSLYFPPKKHLGNKDAKFVDERRRKLQEYLRAVMNHTLQTNSILASHPDKNLLISILPFFGESFNSQPSSGTSRPKRERSRTRSLFFRQSGSAQTNQAISQGAGSPQLSFSNYPQYTGL